MEEEHAQLLKLLYACPVGLTQIAGDGTIEMINPLAMQLLLTIARSPLIMNYFDILEDYAPELRNMVDLFTGSQGTVCENHRIFVSPDTKDSGYDANVLACTMIKLTSTRFVTTLSDISKQVAQENRLKQAETWFASLLDGVDDFAVISLDADGCIDGINPSVSSLTGFSEKDTIGRTLHVFGQADPDPGVLSVAEQIEMTRRDGWNLNEMWQKRSNGKAYWCQRLIAVRTEDEGSEGSVISGFTVVLREVIRQPFDAGKLRQMLSRDHLTGAYNRFHFFEVGERACLRSRRHDQPMALVAIDVDDFKAVNDLYGHAVGDEVLKAFSQRCMSLLRPNDIFARLGGEEFVVLLPSASLKDAGGLAERLRAALSKMAIEVPGATLRVTASFGCASNSAEPSTLAPLLSAADQALYLAKRSGRNCVALSSTELAVAR